MTSTEVERYELLAELASGGMGTVYLGRQHGAFGFKRTVAIKSLHPHFAKDDDFRAMFLDEAQITSRIRHPNVVPTLDIVHADDKLLLVMEYVDGVALSALMVRAAHTQKPLPIGVAVAVVVDALRGLHAAHELVDEFGRSLGVVHRDVSPQNIIVGLDGLTRVLDFGIAKASGRRALTRTGEVKGKLGYMPPEQLCDEPLDRRADVYAAGVVLWETLAGKRLFDASNEGAIVAKVLEGRVSPPSLYAAEEISPALDQVVLRALSKEPAARFATAAEMADALVAACAPAPITEVGRQLRTLAPDHVDLQSRLSLATERMTPALASDDDAAAVLDILTRQAKKTQRDGVAASRSRFGAIGVAIAIALASAGVTAMVMSRRAPSSPPPSAGSAPPNAARSEVPPPSAPSAPSASVGREPPAVPSGPVAPTAPQVDAGKHVVPARPPSRKPPKQTVECNPPYVIDADGQRHYKPECFPP